MIRKKDVEKYRKLAWDYFDRAGIILTDKEKLAIEVAEYDLGRFEEIGLQLLTYFNTGRCSARELIILPGQRCPEHFHPPFEDDQGPNIGKEETFRCRYGAVYLYVDGPVTENPKCAKPQGRKEYFTVGNEIVLNPGEQYTLLPGIKHWFCGGPEGAVVSEFSSRINDDADVFTDPDIKRFSVIEEG